MKHSREKYLIAFALLGVMALLAGAALAQSDTAAGKTPGSLHHGMMLQRLATKLNLTEEQQASAKQLFQDLHAKMEPLHLANQQLRTQLKAALQAPNPDAASIGQLVLQMHQSRAQFKPATEELHQKFEALLNPDQLATYKKMLANRSTTFHRHCAAGQAPTQ